MMNEQSICQRLNQTHETGLHMDGWTNEQVKEQYEEIQRLILSNWKEHGATKHVRDLAKRRYAIENEAFRRGIQWYVLGNPPGTEA